MRLVLAMVCLLASSPAWCAETYGAAVERCILATGARYDSPRFKLILLGCEAQVQQLRGGQPGDLISACNGENSDPPEIGYAICAEAAVRKATEDLIITPRRNYWVQCIARQIKTLDDGVSPASDIAMAVQNFCINEFESLANVTAVSQGLNPAPDSLQHQTIRAKVTRDVALPLVLELRASQRQPKAKPAPKISG